MSSLVSLSYFCFGRNANNHSHRQPNSLHPYFVLGVGRSVCGLRPIDGALISLAQGDYF